MGSRRIIAVLLCGFAMLHPAAGSAAEPSTDELPELMQFPELMELHRGRDFFTLRERLADLPDSTAERPAEIRFLEAAVLQAFNQPDGALRILEALPSDALPPDLAAEARYLDLLAHLRLHRYAAARRAARTYLEASGNNDPTRAAEVRGLVPLLDALSDAPPQTAEVKKPSRLVLDQDGRLPVKIEGVKRRLALDTGANFSVLRRSEAEKLELTVRPTDLKVATSTALEVRADVAVADRVEIGHVDYRNVVFLIFPDEALDLPRGRPVAGLVGFPLVEAMGEIRFRRDGIVEVPSRPPRRTLGNLALDNLDPLVPVRWEKDTLLCRLDTGAANTVFYEPFFRSHRERLEAYGRSVRVPVGGVGGTRELPALRLPRMLVTLAAAGLTLRDIDVYTVPTRPPERNYLDCNVGLDALRRYKAYVINFRDMALILE